MFLIRDLVAILPFATYLCQYEHLSAVLYSFNRRTKRYNFYSWSEWGRYLFSQRLKQATIDCKYLYITDSPTCIIGPTCRYNTENKDKGPDMRNIHGGFETGVML